MVEVCVYSTCNDYWILPGMPNNCIRDHIKQIMSFHGEIGHKRSLLISFSSICAPRSVLVSLVANFLIITHTHTRVTPSYRTLHRILVVLGIFSKHCRLGKLAILIATFLVVATVILVDNGLTKHDQIVGPCFGFADFLLFFHPTSVYSTCNMMRKF